MKEEIQERWAVALESDLYKQGPGQLHDPVKKLFCCLGVLCDLYLIENFMTWDIRHLAGTLDPTEGYLPKEVQEWAGLEDENVTLPTEDSMGASAVILNDVRGYSFHDIAQKVRRL